MKPYYKMKYEKPNYFSNLQRGEVIFTNWRDYIERLDREFDVELIPVKRVAEYLGVSIWSIRQDKNLKLTKVGGKYFVSKIELAHHLAA